MMSSQSSVRRESTFTARATARSRYSSSFHAGRNRLMEGRGKAVEVADSDVSSQVTPDVDSWKTMGTTPHILWAGTAPAAHVDALNVAGKVSEAPELLDAMRL